MTEYCQRRDLFQKERRYTLSPRCVEWTDSGGECGGFDFADVERVELKFVPTRYQRNLHRTVLRGRAKQKLKLTNTHFKGLAAFEDRSAIYVPFLRELHRALAAANPSVRYTRGMSHFGYTLTLVLCLIGGVGALFGAYYGLVKDNGWLLFDCLLLLAVGVLRMWSYLAKNRPGSYDPLELSDELLPQVKS
ncbi:MAG TPA: hypothetical protein ENJ09_12925 [Planctomycetes bacterium]|nr:hypothetical protein [Planctomycetota bacterium]